MTEFTPKFITIWHARYIPDKTHAFEYYPPQDYYFLTKDKLDAFIKKNDKIKFSIITNEAIAILKDNVFYPISNPHKLLL